MKKTQDNKEKELEKKVYQKTFFLAPLPRYPAITRTPPNTPRIPPTTIVTTTAPKKT